MPSRSAVATLLLASAGRIAAQAPPADIQELVSLLQVKVTAASKQLEPEREAPVPVTVVTAEMIALSGARTLLEVLTRFVPGMTQVQDQNEYVVAMRGVYTSSQQKILVLLDGHRLNSRAYSMAAPDYSISLDKLQQIEVLRGPASSLYGNVALTAVVNLVTKRGKDVDGTQAVVGGGSFGQRSAGLLHGAAFNGDRDLLIWGTSYQARGEARRIPAEEDYSRLPVEGQALLDAFRDPPSYDLGLRYSGPGFTLLAVRRSAKYTEPLSAGGATGEVYDFGRYRTLLGTGPGLHSTSSHLGVQVQKDLARGWELDARFHYDSNDLTAPFVIDPATQSFGAPAWTERDFGVTADFTRGFGRPGREGSLLCGFQFDQMQLVDSAFPRGANGNWTSFSDSLALPLLQPGQERTISGYIQLKQRFSRGWILNAGARLDHKTRHTGASVEDLGPRVALVWMPGRVFEMKLSYARSFVDAPYWYRYNSLPSYRGAVDLRPEHLESLQLTPSWSALDGRLHTQVNLFVNHLRDIIHRNNQAAPSEPIYSNSGSLRTWGSEWESAFVEPRFRARVNATYQRATAASGYGVRDGRIYNIPAFSGNLLLDWDLGATWGRSAWLHATYQHLGARLSPIEISFPAQGGPVPTPARSWSLPDHTLPAVGLLHLGLRIPGLFGRRSFLDLRVSNATDAQWKQGGSVVSPYPQPGRWTTLKLGFALDPLLVR